MATKSKVKFHYPEATDEKRVSALQGIAMDSGAIEDLASNPEKYQKLGVFIKQNYLDDYAPSTSMAMDAGIVGNVTPPSNGTPVQFLQSFLPGVVRVITKVRMADRIAPVITAGEWHQEEVVLSQVENIGLPKLYSDFAGVPLASFNETFVRRQIVRFELGALMSRLTDLRAAATGNLNPQEEKRASITTSLEMIRNDVAFNGFNVGTGETYGLLNDPNLPSYVTLPNGAGGDNTWSSKTVAERISDLVSAAAALRVQSGGNIDPKTDAMKLTMPLSVVDLMSESDSSFSNGKTVNQWLSENYHSWTVESAPQFDGADGGENVFYLQAENVVDSGTDDGAVMEQVVPARIVALGTEQKAKGVLEDHTNALAGVFVKRPYGIYRASGL